MAKLSKEEFIAKIEEKLPEELKIEFMEDVADSFDGENNSEEIASKDAEIEKLKAENEELRAKYKERFLKSDESEEEKSDEDDDELKEEEIIDVEEI